MCSSNKYVIISGDVNARTEKLTDHVKLDNYFSDLFDFDEDMANLLDKTDILDNLGIPLTRSWETLTQTTCPSRLNIVDWDVKRQIRLSFSMFSVYKLVSTPCLDAEWKTRTGLS